MIENKSYTWEQAVIYLQSLPEYKQLIIDAYLDENPIEAVERYAESEEFQEVISLLRKTGHANGRLLDIGAGNGIASFAFATQGYEVFALEPDKSLMVGAGAIQRVMLEKSVNISLIGEYGENILLPDSSVDVIFARQVLHHARSLPKMCEEIYRVLKPGGCLLAIREHVVSNEKQLGQFLRNHPLHSMYGGENAYRLKEYVSALKKAGFTNVSRLGPFDTVINYAPLSTEDFHGLYTNKLHRFLPLKFTKALVYYPLTRTFLMKMASIIVKSPGRLYSFIAVK